MFRHRDIAVALLVACVGLTRPAGAQTTTWNDGLDWLAPRVIADAIAGERVDSVKAKAQTIFIASDLSGRGVPQADYDLTEQLHPSGQRQTRISHWTRLGLDGDGRVTRAEIERARLPEAVRSLRPRNVTATPSPEQIASVLDRLVRESLADDFNGDGVITLDEVLEAHRRHMDKQPRSGVVGYLVPLSLDRNGDGIVSAQEFDAAVTEVIARLDTNQDGVVSQAELEAARAWVKTASLSYHESLQMRRAADLARSAATTCAFPKPPAEAKVILVGAYEGQALSNVSLGDDDDVTTVAQIAIERGTEPLYVVATSFRAVIWQLSGATERVAMFVAVSQQAAPDKRPRVGVTGLAAERVFFAPQANCIKHFSEATSTEAITAKSQLLASTGRSPDDLLGAYAMNKVALPSGIVSPGAPYASILPIPSSGPGEACACGKQLLARAEAGLAQLLDEGALVVARSGRVIELGGLARIYGDAKVDRLSGVTDSYILPRELRIVGKMRFPAGLHGAHATHFILGKGVPMPEGDPGHSQIDSEESGQQLRAPRL